MKNLGMGTMVALTDVGSWEKCLGPSLCSGACPVPPACSFGTPPGEHPGKELSHIAMWHKTEANKRALLCLHCEQAGEREFEEGFKRQDVINRAELAKHLLMERWHRRKRREHLSGLGRSTRDVCISEMVLESGEARAAFSKEKQEVSEDGKGTLRSQGPRAAPSDLRLTLRSPDLMKVGWTMRTCGFEGSQSWAIWKGTSQTSGVGRASVAEGVPCFSHNQVSPDFSVEL